MRYSNVCLPFSFTFVVASLTGLACDVGEDPSTLSFGLDAIEGQGLDDPERPGAPLEFESDELVLVGSSVFADQDSEIRMYESASGLTILVEDAPIGQPPILASPKSESDVSDLEVILQGDVEGDIPAALFDDHEVRFSRPPIERSAPNYYDLESNDPASCTLTDDGEIFDANKAFYDDFAWMYRWYTPSDWSALPVQVDSTGYTAERAQAHLCNKAGNSVYFDLQWRLPPNPDFNSYLVLTNVGRRTSVRAFHHTQSFEFRSRLTPWAFTHVNQETFWGMFWCADSIC
jgi:hypothetical protein